MVINAMPSTQLYSVIGPVRQGLVRALFAGARSWIRQRYATIWNLKLTCMNAVAMMTPEPKYFAMKNAHDGIPTPLCRCA